MKMASERQDNVNGFEPRLPLEELSQKITRNASAVSQYLKAASLPQPSFEYDGPSNVVPGEAPQDIRQAQRELISASLEMLHLAIGPSEFVPNLATNFHYVSCISWLCQFNIIRLVPLDGRISYADLAAAAKVPKQRLKSIVRMAITNGLFREEDDGKYLCHSATSSHLARNPDVLAWASYICRHTAPMSLKMAEAHQRWGPDTTSPNETAFNAAYDTNLPFFEYIEAPGAKVDPEEFAAYMRNVRNSKGIDIQHLVNGFDWRNIRQGGTVVDVGGSTGTSAIALAKAFHHLQFVVQDLPTNIESGRKAAAQSLPADVLSRLSFQGHDFTHPQPVQGADVYLLRMILHDWPDEIAVTIVRNLVAAMSEGSSRLLIMDTVLPKPRLLPLSVERIVRARDMTMLQAFNSKERDLDDWKDLLAAADKRLQLRDVVQPFGSDMAVLNIELRGP